MARSNLKLAMREYDSALHMFTPFSPFIDRSAQALWQIGNTLEEQGRPDWALLAYSSLRSSFYASRSFFTPGKQWIARCDEKLADINVKLLVETGGLYKGTREEATERLTAVYQFKDAPSVSWTIVACLGFIGWISSIFAVSFIGMDNVGKRKTAAGILVFVFTYCLWILGLLNA